MIHRYRCTNLLERRLGVPVPLLGPSMLRDLRRLAEWADVVIAHGHVYVGSACAALAARRSATPFVLVQHSPFVAYGKILDRVERRVDRVIGAKVIRSAEAVVTVSRYTQDFVRSLAPDVEPLVIHPGVDSERFAPPPERLDHERLTFLTVRRLVPRNGVDVLVESWRKAALGDRARLVIAGAGPEGRQLRALAAEDDSIDFLGFVAEDTLPDLYRDADVFVLPSRSGEGFGLAAAEALASGIPVVATASGGVTDLVHNGTNGLLVPPNDVAALAEALSAMVGDAPLRERLRRGARHSVEQCHGIVRSTSSKLCS